MGRLRGVVRLLGARGLESFSVIVRVRGRLYFGTEMRACYNGTAWMHERVFYVVLVSCVAMTETGWVSLFFSRLFRFRWAMGGRGWAGVGGHGVYVCDAIRLARCIPTTTLRFYSLFCNFNDLLHLYVGVYVCVCVSLVRRVLASARILSYVLLEVVVPLVCLWEAFCDLTRFGVSELIGRLYEHEELGILVMALNMSRGGERRANGFRL